MNEHVALRRSHDADYDVDIYAWTRDQVELLQQRRFDAIDLENIIEEIDSLGKEQIHAVESHLIGIGEHLLKLLVSSDTEPRHGWRTSVKRHRRQLERRLKKNPALRREVPALINEAWTDVIGGAADGLTRPEEQALVMLMPQITPQDMQNESYLPD